MKKTLKKKDKTPWDDGYPLWEQLNSIVRDLENIEKLLPKEISRVAYKQKLEPALLIQSRKNNLLRYIQTICRDNIYWGKKVLEGKYK